MMYAADGVGLAAPQVRREGDREREREIERNRERVRDNHAVVKVQYFYHIKSTEKGNTRKKRHRFTILQQYKAM